MPPAKPVIVHILEQLHVGGMETVAVDLIERSLARYDHRVISLCGHGWHAARLQSLGVSVSILGKRPGKDPLSYIRLWRMLRDLQPDIVHTYNIGTIDAAPSARAAGVRRVVHAEHGRDAADPCGQNIKYRWLRRVLSPAINAFVPVSGELAAWLSSDVGIPQCKIRLIYNGIDTEKYRPDQRATPPWSEGFTARDSVVIGSVGRLDSVKAYDVLLQAFARVCRSATTATPRLVIVGDGPERPALEKQLQELEIEPWVWLAGERDDVPRLLQAMDVYVCSSIAEGMALTILEAMASGLPVIATRVGGNPELVVPQETGSLVPASDPDALAQALEAGLAQPRVLREQGAAGCSRAQAHFSVDAMVSRYCALYEQLLGTASATVQAG